MISPTDPAATCSGSACCNQPWVARSAALLAGPALVWLVGSLLIAVAVRWGTVSPVAGRDAFWVGAICFAASAASLLPLVSLSSRPAAQLPVWLLLSVGIRGGVSVLALVGSIAAGWIDRGAVAVPVSLWYGALLIADLVVVSRFFSNALPVSTRTDSERATC